MRVAKEKVTFYQLLGVEPGVSTHEIKKAYRQLAKSFHPDIGHQAQSSNEREEATELMMRLNEAYETLIDTHKRDAYDSRIGANGKGQTSGRQGSIPTALDEDFLREQYMRNVFTPSRQAIARVLKQYASRLRDLSQDIYDEELVQQFALYVDEVEASLRKASQLVAGTQTPKSLRAAVQWLRHSIAQGADGLDELRRFCQNYDYNHLTMAENLFRIAIDHCKRALADSK